MSLTNAEWILLKHRQVENVKSTFIRVWQTQSEFYWNMDKCKLWCQLPIANCSESDQKPEFLRAFKTFKVAVQTTMKVFWAETVKLKTALSYPREAMQTRFLKIKLCLSLLGDCNPKCFSLIDNFSLSIVVINNLQNAIGTK